MNRPSGPELGTGKRQVGSRPRENRKDWPALDRHVMLAAADSCAGSWLELACAEDIDLRCLCRSFGQGTGDDGTGACAEVIDLRRLCRPLVDRV